MNRQQRQAHRAVWFEIPSQDFERATRFYEHLTGSTLKREDCGGNPIAVFAQPEAGVSGCIVHGEPYQPGRSGVCVYLNVDSLGLDAALARVEAAGGKLVTPPCTLPDNMGRYAHICDSEGNFVGLHEAGA